MNISNKYEHSKTALKLFVRMPPPKMQNLTALLTTLILLGALFVTTAPAQTKSNDKTPAVVSEEQRLSTLLIEALERENTALRNRLESEKSTNALLTELAETHKAESAALRETIVAKNDVIAADRAVIASQEKLIAELRKKRGSIWKRIADIAAGAAIGAILR